MTEQHQPNRLINSTSPYLRQHAHQPVDWYPWGAEALQRAVDEDKPIFLSIGYAACHWCHVMAEESFEDPAVAAFLNRFFIPVKVDREERPDLDELYMTATQLLTGSGGWPMSVFLLPDQRPFFAGTYFPPKDRYGYPGFLNLLNRIQQFYSTRREELEQSAAQIVAGMRSHLVWTPPSAQTPDSPEQLLSRAAQSLARRFDSRQGGFSPAPKFPPAMDCLLLLRDFCLSANRESLQMVCTTLDAMAHGGVHDQLGGGFHRYSVDDQWLVPHFEKMLYDQAMLARTYCEAWLVTGQPSYREVMLSTLEFVWRDLLVDGVGFASSLDADTDGEEGTTYTWTTRELQQCLDPYQAEQAARFFGVTPQGNFEHGRSVLHRPLTALLSQPDTAATDPQPTQSEWQAICDRMMAQRNTRPQPRRDDKVLTDWNALMISAMAWAGWSSGQPVWLQRAEQTMTQLLEQVWDGQTVLHLAQAGTTPLSGFLADYANLVMALFDLYQVTFNPLWLNHSVAIYQRMLELFAESTSQPFYNTPTGAENILLRPTTAVDNVMPSGNSMAAWVSYRLGLWLGKADWIAHGRAVLDAFATPLRQNSAMVPWLVMTSVYDLPSAGRVALVSPRDLPAEWLQPFQQDLLPHLVWGDIQDLPRVEQFDYPNPPAAQICRQHACGPVLTDLDQLCQALKLAGRTSH